MSTTPTPYTPTDDEVLVVIEDRLHDAMLTYCIQEPDGEMTTYIDAPIMEVLRIVEDALAARDARVRAEAIAPVLALHTSHRWGDGAQTCDHCTDPDGIEQMPYPCPTVRAASIEQETQPERTTCTRCEGDGAVYNKALADLHPFPFVCPVCKGDGDVPAEQETQP